MYGRYLYYGGNDGKSKVNPIARTDVKMPPIAQKAEAYLKREDRRNDRFRPINKTFTVRTHVCASKSLYDKIENDDDDPEPVSLVIVAFQGTNSLDWFRLHFLVRQANLLIVCGERASFALFPYYLKGRRDDGNE